MIARKLAAAAVALSVGFMTAPAAHAAIFTDQTAFDNAAALGGITLSTDKFAGNAIGTAITNGGTLNAFTYHFDPAQVAPGVASDGMGGHALGDISLGTDPNTGTGVFSGGQGFSLTHSGGTLRAFGALFSYAPAFENLPGGLYNLTLHDGAKAGTTVGSPDQLDGAGGSFFLGFVVNAGDLFSTVDLTSLTDEIDDSGQFDFLTTAFQVNELDFGPAAAVTAVPEPASLVLLFTGLGFVCAFTRRRATR